MKGNQMTKYLIAVALSFTAISPAFSADNQGKMYLDISGGKTYGLNGLDNGTSTSALFGYQFNPKFSAEGGYTSLANNANINNLATGVTGNSSVAGGEVAALINFPVTLRSAIFARLGYAYMMATGEVTNLGTNTTLSEVDFAGATYGLGVKYYLGRLFAVSAGFNVYQLNNSSCTTTTGCTISPTTVHADLVFRF